MSPFIERLGWVLIHSLWQLAVLAAAAFVVQRAMGRTSAAARYAVLLAMLGLVVAAPIVTWSLLPVPEAISAPELTAERQSPVPSPAPKWETIAPAVAPVQIVVPSTPPITPVAPAPVVPSLPVAIPKPVQTTWSEWAQRVITPWLSTIVWGWSLGVLAFAIRPLWSWFTVRQLRTHGVSPVPESVQAALRETARRLGMTQAVRVLQSTIVQVPIVAGYLKPVILLPASIVTGLPTSQLEAILAHELAHIRRHDYLVNLLQTLVETVFFYHPAVWWLSHQIRCERENCCDDIAVSVLGSRLDYSRALLAVEELRGTPTTLAVGASGGSLLGRVRRLFHRDLDQSSLSSGSVALGATLIVGVLTIAAIAGTRGADTPDLEVTFAIPTANVTSWPQLGGSAAHNPISPVTNLPTQFDLTKKENIRWTQPIGDFSFSSPVVSGGNVLIGTNNAVGRDPRLPASIDRACLQCFDERTGEFLWQYSSPKMEQGRRHDWPAIGICSTPVIEGDRVWFATNRCEIVCLDLNGHRDNEDDGEPEASAPGDPGAANTLTPSPSPGGRGEKEQQADVVWKYDMFNTLGVRPLNATCVTSTIAGDLLLLNSGNDVDESYQTVPAPEAPAFLAFHKSKGQLIWSDKSPNPNILGNGCSMGAPAVAQIDGTWQAIFAGYDGWLYSFDLADIQRGTTQLLWKFDVNPKEAQFRINGPRSDLIYRGLPSTPVVVGNRVYATVGHNPERGEGLGRLWCIDATRRGDISSELVYNKAAPEVVIPHKRAQACEPDKGDFTRPNPNSGVVWVYTTDDLNKNGKIEFEEEMHLSNSLPAIHDGLLLISDLSGLVHCLDVTSGKLLWTHDQLAACWSGPLLADGKVWTIDEDGDLTIFALARQKQLLAEHYVNAPGFTNFAAANATLYVATKTQLVAIGSGKFPEPGGVTAKLPGGLEIELVGITPNAAPTLKGWRADGSPIEGAGDWPRGATFSKDGDRFTITTDGASKLPPVPSARDLLFEGRGLRSHPSWVILNPKGVTQFESVNADEAIRRRLSYLPKESGQPLTVEMALTDSPWGPWQRIDKSGKRINKIETFEPDQKLYEEIKFLRFGPALQGNAQRPLELVLDEPATHDDYQSGVFDITVRFIGTDQKVWTTYAQPKSRQDGRRQVIWRTGGDVSMEKIDHIEFRLRPYRHFLTFKNVPLDRTAGAQVAVEHRSLPLPPTHAPDPRFTAQVPGGVEIELLRIVRNDLPEHQSWTPDGKPSPGLLDWPQRSHYKVHPDGNGHSSSNEGPGSDRAWDFAYEVRRAGSKPFVSVDVSGEGSTSSSQFLPAIGPQLVTVLPKVPESLTAFQLRVGNEPWGQWIQVGADGKVLNPEAINTKRNSPEPLIWIAGAGIDEDNPDRSWFKWMALPHADQLYSMEVRAIDDDGQVHLSRSGAHTATAAQMHEITKWFDLPVEKLNRFEYRMRPYRHLVTFDHICTDPAKPTEVKVSVEPILFPNEVAAPSNLKSPQLQLQNPDGTLWQGNLTEGHVGFTAPDAKAWSTWVSKDGRADLSQLPEGKHWLITRYPFSVNRIETPLKQSPQWQPLRLGTPPRQHSSSNYSAELKRISGGGAQEFIEIHVTNSTDELWSFSELDLTLEAGWLGQESQGHSPLWLENDLSKVKRQEIPARGQGTLRIDWNDWVTRGVWDPMVGPEAVSKPALPEQQPGQIWVRIQGPGFGTIPISVTHPDRLLVAGDEPAPQPPAPDNLDRPRVELIGLTYDSVPKKDTWNTNGQPLLAPDWVQQLPKLNGDDKSKPAPLFLFEVHGLRAMPSFRHRYQPAVVSGDDELPEGRPYRMAVLYEDLKPEERNQFIIWGEHPAVRMTDEPWGPWRTITKEGQFAEPLDPNTLYREGYDMVTLHGFRPLTKKPNDPEPAPDAVRTGLVLKHPQDYDALYAIEIEAVPSTAGPQLVNVFTSRPVKSIRHANDDGWDIESEWPVDPSKIDHLRYRIRPYRHRFEFQEVAYKPYQRPATSAPFKVIYKKLEHDLPKPTGVKVSEEPNAQPSPNVQRNQDEKLNPVEQLFEKVAQMERGYGDFDVTMKTKYEIEYEPSKSKDDVVTVRSTTVERSLIVGNKFQYGRFTRSTNSDKQIAENSESCTGECDQRTLQGEDALRRPHQLLLRDPRSLVNHLYHTWSNGHLLPSESYRKILVGEESLFGLECVKVQLLENSVLRQELWLAKERHYIPIKRVEIESNGVLRAISEVTEFQELNPGRWFPKRSEWIRFETDTPVDVKKVRWRKVTTLERYSATPVWTESDLSQFATDDQPPVNQPDLKDQASGLPASSDLVRKLSDLDQAVRDQAAAQLKTLFKPTAKEPWQAKIDAIAKDTPRADVFAKLGIDEKQDLYAAINTTEDYRLDDTWMVRITFTGDLQQSVTMELIELLHRPWIDPPADFTGTWVTYYVNGEKAHEIEYRNGKYHGRHRSYHSNGKLLVQQHYTDHVANGEDTGYFASGKLMYRGLYEDDKQVGTWIHYHEDGSERSRTEHPQPTLGSPATPNEPPPVEIRVIDAETEMPIADAGVTLRQVISAWQPRRTDAAHAKVNLSNSIPEFRTTAKTNATGEFSFTIPRELRDWQSDLQFSVRHPDYVIEQSFGAFQVTPEMAADPSLLNQKVFDGGVIRLKRGHEISGLITGPDGKPAAGVKLYAAWQMPQYLNMPPHAVTDAQGRYKFRTVKESESDHIFVIPQDGVAVSFPLNKKYGEHPPIQLERGAVITGQVRGSDGKPLAGAVVEANGSDSAYDGFPKPMARVLTDAEGRYTLPPQKPPVDVRVSPLGWLGGWSPSGNVLSTDEVYLPVLARAPGANASGSLTVDFQPCETVKLTAMVYDEKGQPASVCELAVFGTVPDPLRTQDQRGPFWRGRFHAVQDRPGVFIVHAPKGLEAATLVDPEIPTGPRQKWTRAVDVDESIPGPRADKGWTVLMKDDDSIIVGEPAALIPMTPGSETSATAPDKNPDVGPWGLPVDGLRSRLRLTRDPKQSSSPWKVGQPVMVTLEIENVSDAEKQFSLPAVFSSGDVRVSGTDGKPCHDIRGPLSVQLLQHTLQPGEVKAFVEQQDLTKQVLMTEPGEYRVRVNSPSISNELTSGELRFTLEEGLVPPVWLACRDLQTKAPPGSLLLLVNEQVWIYVSGQVKSTEPNPVVKLWHQAETVPSENRPPDVIELLTPGGSGVWYAEIPEDAKTNWTTVEQDLLSVAENVTREMVNGSLIPELGLWGVPATRDEILSAGLVRIPEYTKAVKVTAIEPGGYVDAEVKAGRLKFEVPSLIHSVAGRDVGSTSDVSARIAETRQAGHEGFFVGGASLTDPKDSGKGRFSVGFSDLRRFENDKSDPRKPWRAVGRVVDGEGNPLAGVTVRAATGMGTLLGGGSGVTDAEGRYDFRFGFGMLMGRQEDGRTSPQTQYALISAHLDGHFEKSFNQQGEGIGSLEPVTEEVAKEWGVEPTQVVLPDKPREVNFVMLPAVRVAGTLVGENDQPLKGYSVMLTGDRLPPGASVLAQVQANEQGRFEIKDIPTSAKYQFVIRKPGKELMPPWDDAWASPPLKFESPGENDFVATSDFQKLTGKSLVLKITGPGVHDKTAKERAAQRRVELKLDSADVNPDPDGKGQVTELNANVLTVVLSNSETPRADSPDSDTQDKSNP